LNHCPSNSLEFHSTRYQHCFNRVREEEIAISTDIKKRRIRDQEAVSMPGELTDFLAALLRLIIGGVHRRYRHGGRCPRPGMERRARRRRRALVFDEPAPMSNHHFRLDAGGGPSTTTYPPPTSSPACPRVLEGPPFTSPDRPVEPLGIDTSSRGNRGRPCAIHGWGGCPNLVAPAARSTSPDLQIWQLGATLSGVSKFWEFV
jgi:hypothetical protein